jgi:hypothetical protein
MKKEKNTVIKRKEDEGRKEGGEMKEGREVEGSTTVTKEGR